MRESSRRAERPAGDRLEGPNLALRPPVCYRNRRGNRVELDSRDPALVTGA
jgi:hypothetical protein